MMERPGEQSRVLFRWPTWSPTADRIAFEGLAVHEEGVEQAVLWVVSADGVRAEALTDLPAEGVVYLRWRNDGEDLLLLRPGEQGRLRLGEARGDPSLIDGAPLFVCSLEGGGAIAHVWAGDLHRARLVHLPDQGEAHTITERPGPFRTPAVLTDGSVVFVIRENDCDRLVSWTPANGIEELFPAPAGRIALIPDPGGGVLIASGPEAGTAYERLERASAPHWTPEMVCETPFQAAFPISRAGVALVEAEESGAFSWAQVDGSGADPRIVFRFVPTEEEALRLGFFDQYHGSHSPIAPGGDALVVAGVDVSRSPLPEEPHLYLVPLDGSLPRSLGPGRFATWAPRA